MLLLFLEVNAHSIWQRGLRKVWLITDSNHIHSQSYALVHGIGLNILLSLARRSLKFDETSKILRGDIVCVLRQDFQCTQRHHHQVWVVVFEPIEDALTNETTFEPPRLFQWITPLLIEGRLQNFLLRGTRNLILSSVKKMPMLNKTFVNSQWE